MLELKLPFPERLLVHSRDVLRDVEVTVPGIHEYFSRVRKSDAVNLKNNGLWEFTNDTVRVYSTTQAEGEKKKLLVHQINRYFKNMGQVVDVAGVSLTVQYQGHNRRIQFDSFSHQPWKYIINDSLGLAEYLFKNHPLSYQGTPVRHGTLKSCQ